MKIAASVLPTPAGRLALLARVALSTLPLLAACGAADDTAISGYAEADLVYLAPSAAGTLETLNVRRGDRVTRGQTLYALDVGAESLTRDAALARSEQAAAQAADLGKGRRPLELRQIEQQVAQAQAALAASTDNLARNRRLVDEGYIAPLQLESLTAARDRDAARVKELQAQRAQAAEASRRDEIEAAAAAARGAQADLALAKWREGQKARAAPGDAVVFDVMFRVGEWVPAGAPVLSLLPPGAVKVRFFATEPQLPQLAIGSTVAVSCDGCPGGLTARVRFVSPQAEFTPPVIYSNSSRSKLVFMVEAEPLAAAAQALKPGQPVDVRIAAAAK